MTIYSIKKKIEEIFGAFTVPSHGVIYPTLKKLAESGYVSSREILSEGGKKSSYFCITEKGKKHFSEIMLSDFSENPAVSLNEINIRISAINVLNTESKKLLINNCIKYIDLYITKTERIINNEYIGLNDYQKRIMNHSINNSKQLIQILESFKI